MVFNNKVVSQNFLSAPLSHYDVILGEPWLRDNKIIMDYAHSEVKIALIIARKEIM